MEQITSENFPRVSKIGRRYKTEDEIPVNINEFFESCPIFSIREPSKERILRVLKEETEKRDLEWPRSPAYMLSNFIIGVYSATLLNIYYNP